ncbi:MAG: DNA-directed RNA polymerase subunit beta [Nitrospinae bacterium]|nr:DNA-directed RNA polymerase subunit beta [Nitrospinota bacterium]
MNNSSPSSPRNRIERTDFAKISSIVDIPDLIEIQKSSYERFLQKDVNRERRDNVGLQEVFNNVFPIYDYNGLSFLEFIGYEIGIWWCGCGEYSGWGGDGVVCSKCGKKVQYKEKYTIEECAEKGITYAAPLRIVVQLVTRERDKDGVENIREIKEQKVYLGEIPLMTDTGTFVVNGTERVVVSQLHRSPGVFFLHEKGSKAKTGKAIHAGRLIPYRGSWLDFEFDSKDILHVRIDRRRKLNVSVFLKALGFTTSELLKKFYPEIEITYDKKNNDFFIASSNIFADMKAKDDINDPASGEVIIKAGRKFNKRAIRKLENAKIKKIPVEVSDIVNRIIASDLVDSDTGEILLETGQRISEENVSLLKDSGVKTFAIFDIDERAGEGCLRETLLSDKSSSKEEALKEIYKRMRPGEPPTEEAARLLFEGMFFNPKRYDLSSVGRMKLNKKLGLDIPLTERLLTPEDILRSVKYLLDLRKGIGEVDDIDHLGNRRVRSVGESMENQFRLGMVRMERVIVERMSVQDIDTCMPQDLINSKPVTAAIKEFFGSSQLSQFMDQTNPLSEITHKRRLSALGPGGLTRERAGFEVRDVHPTHYGRICPIETPEGPNIGLIASLSTYARVNDFGFIEVPYRKVKDGLVSKEVVYLSAMDEGNVVMAPANAELDSKGHFVSEIISARKGGDFVNVAPDEINYMDVSPKQLVSVAASLIPFLEHDDANRALMGSNMQRQAVPLLHTEAPIVGTGMESKVARDSGACIVAKHKGEVLSVSARRVIVRYDLGQGESVVEVHPCIKYARSNQNTCINQIPVVLPGDKFAKGDVLADGSSTDRGDLALGRNVMVAFMPWEGYNYEDAIIISEKLVKDDYYSSVHIEEFQVEARETKQGREEITRDIPNVGEDSLKDMDESGIIRIGARVTHDDILVGKVTPKVETLLSPEEKLLKAIFGEKAGEWRDSSLRVPPGAEGIVTDVQIFSRKGADKDKRAKEIEEDRIVSIKNDVNEQIRFIKDDAAERIKKLVIDKNLSNEIKKKGINIPKKKKLTGDILAGLSYDELALVKVPDKDAMSQIDVVVETVETRVALLNNALEDKKALIKKGDELSPGVIKSVKVFVAMKRKIKVGDKMAGRHGNKGVVSRVVPEEDMPFMDDGTPVDIILNPLGVPSRMNVGQILETYLGLAGKKLGKYYATQVFDGAKEEEIMDLLREAGYDGSGKVQLLDGKTGKPFAQKTVVGQIYMLKLHHLVDDKIHARSTGPYSLITQQPLGGKAQFGGQRLGEMEVWALEAYGAGHTLREMLTVKSDDIEGRRRMYESIVRGDDTLQAGMPESFNVLVKEMQSLCLDVELVKDKK